MVKAYTNKQTNKHIHISHHLLIYNLTPPMVIVVEANKYNDHMSVKSSSLKDGIFKHYHLKKLYRSNKSINHKEN